MIILRSNINDNKIIITQMVSGVLSALMGVGGLPLTMSAGLRMRVLLYMGTCIDVRMAVRMGVCIHVVQACV